MFDKVTPGQTVRIHYEGGTKPGHRVVQVYARTPSLLKGIDLEVRDHRQYHAGKTSYLRVVADVGEEVVYPKSFLAGEFGGVEPAKLESIYRLLTPEAQDVRYDGEVGALVVRKRHEPTVQVVIDGPEIEIRFGNQRGNLLGIRFRGEEPLVVEGRTGFACKLHGETARDLAAKLALHYAEEAAPAEVDASLAGLVQARLDR